MDIFTKTYSPPQELQTKDFCLFPTNQDFYLSDYEAVVKSRDLLRDWSQSQWPEDDFTPEQNKEDLGQHVQDNIDHSAYGYMIYSLDKTICFGSVYVNPLSPVPDNYHTTKEEETLLASHQARIDYWVIDDPILDEKITKELRAWFKDVWRIKVFFSARIQMKVRLEIYQRLHYKKALDLKSKTSDMTLLLF